MTTKTSPRSFTSSRVETHYQKDGDIVTSANPFTETWADSVTHGDNIPGWRDKIRRGEDATTSLTGTRLSVDYVPGFVDVQRPKTGLNDDDLVRSKVNGSMNFVMTPPTGNPDTISITKANNAALRGFSQKVLRVNTAIQGGVVLGEIRQTLYGIRNPASGLRRLVTDLRQRGFQLRRFWRWRTGSLAALNRALAELWLEYSFHWKPLLNDIDSGCRALAEIQTGQALYSESVSDVGESYADPVESTLNRQDGLARWRETSISKSHAIVIYRGAVRARVANPVLMTGTLLGFQPSQFIPTVWELIPYSFLIDYFTNIGDILQGWSVGTGELTWCNRTIRRSLEVEQTSRTDFAFVKALFPTVSSVSWSPARVAWSKTNVSRAKYSGAFAPSFEWEIPGFRSRRWLNIAALVVNRRSDRSFQHGD